MNNTPLSQSPMQDRPQTEYASGRNSVLAQRLSSEF